jgi:hypothetical protein
VGSLLLVGLSRGVVLVLLGLVLQSVDTGLGTASLSVHAWGSESRRKQGLPVADSNIGVLGDLLVGLLGSLVGGALDLVCGRWSVRGVENSSVVESGTKPYRRRS